MYDKLVQSVLEKIESEMERLYWNSHQEEMRSPFRNTGEEYNNDTFSVFAYYWGDDEREMRKPNFVYKGFCARWYKHVGRGLIWTCNEELTINYLDKMLNDCIESMQKDFGEIEK